MNKLAADGALAQHFNTGLFTYGASSRPESSGMGVAIIGSFYMMVIVLLLALPIGVAASIYLEEFAKKIAAYRPHRGQHQQSGGGAVDRVRPARPCRLHQLPWPAALGRRWSAAWC